MRTILYTIFFLISFVSQLYAQQIPFSNTVDIGRLNYQAYPVPDNFTNKQFVKSINFDILNQVDRLRPGQAYKITIMVPPGTVSMSVSGVATMDGEINARPVYAAVEGSPLFLCHENDNTCSGVKISYPPFNVGNSGFTAYIYLDDQPLPQQKQMSFLFYQGANASYDFALQSSFRITYVIEDFTAYNQWLGTTPPTSPQYSLTIGLTEGGTVSGSGISCNVQAKQCSGTYSQGTSVVLSAEPQQGYYFSNWKGNCLPESEDVNRSVVVIDGNNKTCSAQFTAVPQQAGGFSQTPMSFLSFVPLSESTIYYDIRLDELPNKEVNKLPEGENYLSFSSAEELKYLKDAVLTVNATIEPSSQHVNRDIDIFIIAILGNDILQKKLPQGSFDFNDEQVWTAWSEADMTSENPNNSLGMSFYKENIQVAKTFSTNIGAGKIVLPNDNETVQAVSFFIGYKLSTSPDYFFTQINLPIVPTL